MVLTFESVNEILKSDHSNKSYRAIFFGTVYHALQAMFSSCFVTTLNCVYLRASLHLSFYFGCFAFTPVLFYKNVAFPA